MTFIGKQTSYISLKINQRIQPNLPDLSNHPLHPRNDTKPLSYPLSLSPSVICSLPIKRTFRPNREAIRAIRCSDSMEFDPPCAYTRGWTTIFVPCLFGPPSGDTKNRQVAKLSDPMRVLIFAYEREDSEELSKLTHIYIVSIAYISLIKRIAI